MLDWTVSWAEEYPYAFLRWFGPLLPVLEIHHPEYAKSILCQTGKSLPLPSGLGSHVLDTSLPRKPWKTCLEPCPLPASFTATAAPPLLPVSNSPPAPGCMQHFAFSCKTGTKCLFLPAHCLHCHWSYGLLWFPSKQSNGGELAWQRLSEDISSLLLCSSLWSMMPVRGT